MFPKINYPHSKFSTTLLTCGLLALSSLGAQPVRLAVDSQRIFCEQARGDATRLFDEQDSIGDPLNANGNPATSTWEPGWSNPSWYYPVQAIIDLGGNCQVDHIGSWDGAGSSLITVEAGSPGNWTQLFSYDQSSYQIWHMESVDVETRYLRLTVHGVQGAPSEMVVYGERLEPIEPLPAPQPHVQPTMDRMIGANGFHNIPMGRLAAVGSLRQYYNWNWSEGDGDVNYPGGEAKFETAYTGQWNFDRFYRNAHLSGLSTGADIKANPLWLNEGVQSHEAKPLRPSENRDPLDPASYHEHARFLYQLAARYGSQTVDPSNLRLHPSEPAFSGRGWLRWIENWNEQDKFWYGREGYFSPYEYAAMSSADADGHLGTMGADVGMKTADPSMKLAMSGMAYLNLDYLKAIDWWVEQNRGGDYPFDAINLHHYSNDFGGQGGSTTGISPEADNLRERLEAFRDYRDRYHPGVELWFSEFGWDTNQQSIQRAPAIGSMDGFDVQAAWLARAFLLLGAAGVDRAHMFMMEDAGDASVATKYRTCGLMSISANGPAVPKPSWYYTYTLKRRLAGMRFHSEQDSGRADVWIYRFADANGAVRAYAVWCPTSEDKTVPGYTLDVGGASTADLVELAEGSTSGLETALSISNGSVVVDVSETPILVMIDDPEVGLGPDQLISLSPSNVVNESGYGDAGRMLDEQSEAVGALLGEGGDPITGWHSGWGSLTWPHSAYVDLGQVMPVTYLHFYDGPNSDDLEFSVGEPGNWEVLTRDPLAGYNAWKAVAIMRETRYVRITKFSNASAFNEIALYTNDYLPAIDGPEQDGQVDEGPSQPVFQTEEIGTSGNPAGSFSGDAGAYSISGSGKIATWRDWDTLHFAYLQVSGDFAFSAKVDAVTQESGGAAGLLMARQSLADDSPFAATAMTASLGVSQLTRDVAGADPLEKRDYGPTAPHWVALDRSGDTFSSYRSADGENWTLVQAANLALGETVLLGFGAYSNSMTSLSTADFSEVALAATYGDGSGGGSNGGGSSENLVSNEIGAVGNLPGSMTESGGVYTVEGSGQIASWRNYDTCHFASRAVTGDFDFVARVDDVEGNGSGAVGFLMARASLDDEALFAATMMTESIGVVQSGRAVTPGSPSDLRIYGPIAPEYLRLVRTGDVFDSYYSTDGSNWTLIRSMTVDLPDIAEVGIGAFSTSMNDLATVTFSELEIIE